MERREKFEQQRREALDKWSEEIRKVIKARVDVAGPEHLLFIHERAIMVGNPADEAQHRMFSGSRPGFMDGLTGTPADQNRNARDRIEQIKVSNPRIRDKIQELQNKVAIL